MATGGAAPSAGGRRRQRKQAVIDLLLRRDSVGLLTFLDTERSAIPALFSLLYEKDDLLRWRAIEGVGVLAAHVFPRDPATVRDWVRRQIWAMNEESGNVAWYAPETISEIALAVPPLLGEYGRILASNLGEPIFRRGCLFAVARMVVVEAEPFADLADELAAALGEKDPTMRASAVVSLGALEERGRVAAAGLSRDDPGTMPLYARSAGRIVETTVGRCVRAVLERKNLRALMDGEDIG